MPIFAWVGATTRCNLKCRICITHQFGQHFEDMSPALFERVRRQLLGGVQEVCLSSGGEPFLAPITYRMIDYLLAADKRVWIVTNGTIIRPDYLERLVRSPSRITVSIDGTTRAVYEYIRTGARFDRVMAFMKTLKAIMERAAHPKFQFEVNFAITRSNIGQLVDCVELAHRYGACKVCFLNFVIGGRTDEFALRESLIDRPREVLPYWEAAHKRGLELGVTVVPLMFDCLDSAGGNRPYTSQTTGDDPERIPQCPLPWWVTFVDVDGSVRPCCAWPGHETVGNLHEQSFRAIWNGPRYRELRRTVNTPDMPEHCKHCFLPVRI